MIKRKLPKRKSRVKSRTRISTTNPVWQNRVASSPRMWSKAELIRRAIS